MDRFAQLLPDGTFDHMIETASKLAFGPRAHLPVHQLTPSQRAQFNVVVVQDVAPPEAGQYQRAVRDGAELVDGVWQTRWVLQNWRAEEIAAKQANAVERARLAEIALSLKTDVFLAAIRSRTKAQYDLWWAQRDATDKDKMLKYLLLAEAQR